MIAIEHDVLRFSGFWELVADGQEAPFIEGGGETPLLVHEPFRTSAESCDFYVL